jgi:diaminopimelate epimerase
VIRDNVKSVKSEMQFYKYQALGNDMVVIDPADFELPLTPAAIRLICHRHFGPGADGVCYGPLPNDSEQLSSPDALFQP